MTARAMWKGVLAVGDARVGVKLYAAVESGGVHFRLLHAEDNEPIRQRMVDPRSGDPVDDAEVFKAWETEDGRQVLLRDEELRGLSPEASRTIAVGPFVPAAAVDDYWLDRPYHLRPDGAGASYAALAAALGHKERVGVARWVMRNKQYVGLLSPAGEELVLVTLRHPEQVVQPAELDAPAGRDPERQELELASQLVGALAGPFEPERYQDDYRQKVEALIAKKARGERVTLRRPRPPKEEKRGLADALRESIRRSKKKQVA